MVEILNQILDFLVANYALYLVVTMSIIISLTISLITLIKKPIKNLTKKIKNERLQKLANKVFVVFAFAIAGISWVLLNWWYPKYFPVDAIQILLTGAFSVVLYELADGVVTKSKTQQIIDTITDFAQTEEQNKKQETKKETDPIKEFWKKVKK
jgi:amino acid transporter